MSALHDIPLFEGKPAEVLIVGFGAVGIICGFYILFHVFEDLIRNCAM
jgi:hypothetical protein